MQATLQLPMLTATEQAPLVRVPKLLRSRHFRVVVLIAIGWVLGLADLVMTLTYLMNVGMFEGNPLARWVIAMGSPAIVAGFKLMTMIVSSAILFWQRRRWQAEVGAILAVLVLAKLTFHWLGYIDMSSDLTHAITIAAADPTQCDGMWATLR